MVIAVLSGTTFFIYKTWGPKNEKPSISPRADIKTEEPGHTVEAISTDELKSKLNDKNIIILDVQDRENFIKKHIPQAINIPSNELDERKDELPKDKEIIVMGAGEKVDKCLVCSKAAETLASFGYNVKHYRIGVSGWDETGLPIILGVNTNYKNISAETLKQKIEDKEDIMIVDLRTREEYDESHIKDAVFMQFEGILAKTNEFPQNKEIIFYDKTGERSKLVVEQLVKQGVITAENLVDGFNVWKEKEYPTE